MVDVEIIKKRLDKLAISLKKLERFRHLSFEEYEKDDMAQDVVEYNLFISINMIIDMATHIVVDNRLGSTDSLGGAFSILYKEKFITQAKLKNYRNMVGLRNLLAHEYVNIDKKIIFDVMKNKLSDFEDFIVLVHKKFL